MRLRYIISELDYILYNGSEDIEITQLVCDSRKIVEGCVFVCVKGTVFDGHTFIDEAINMGAAAIITEEQVEITEHRKNTTFIAAADCRNTLALTSAAYFGHPAKRLFTIGITGTKGKTTTAFMVREILERCGYKTGLIGTIEIITGSRHIESSNTTPESYDVQKYFKEMADNGCRCVVMEVSSQALMMKRCGGIMFDIGVFTNLEPDHIGPNEHASFEDYMHCKGLLVNSPKDVATYDLKPEMSAPEVGMDLVEAIKSDKYDVIIINFANPDMVGHTGVIPAAVKAVERVDQLVGDAVQAVKDVDGVLFICADHGNAEKMIDYETGKPHTAHTTNPVPFILVNADPSFKLREGGCLADIAPTLLEIMELPQPAEMTGKSLIVK